jgi:hypothetical protein
LELLSSRGSRGGYGYYTVEGEVKNISGKRLENVEAVATMYDKDGGFITTGSALIDYDPILPGQTSPFKVMVRANPAMERYRVTFKKLSGVPIFHKDSDSRKPRRK